MPGTDFLIENSCSRARIVSKKQQSPVMAKQNKRHTKALNLNETSIVGVPLANQSVDAAGEQLCCSGPFSTYAFYFIQVRLAPAKVGLSPDGVLSAARFSYQLL